MQKYNKKKRNLEITEKISWLNLLVLFMGIYYFSTEKHTNYDIFFVLMKQKTQNLAKF